VIYKKLRKDTGAFRVNNDVYALHNITHSIFELRLRNVVKTTVMMNSLANLDHSDITMSHVSKQMQEYTLQW